MPPEIVTVRLSIEGMRHQIVHAFASHNAEIETVVAAEVARVIKEFDFRAEVAAATTEALRRGVREACDRFFNPYDSTGRKLVNDLANKAIRSGLKPTRRNYRG